MLHGITINLQLLFWRDKHPAIKLFKTLLYLSKFSGFPDMPDEVFACVLIDSGLPGIFDLLYKMKRGYYWSILPLFSIANLLQKSSPAWVPIPPKIPIIKFFVI